LDRYLTVGTGPTVLLKIPLLALKRLKTQNIPTKRNYQFGALGGKPLHARGAESGRWRNRKKEPNYRRGGGS